MICAFSAGLATSWTSICGLSKRNRCSTASVRALIAPPFRPITRPGRSARSVTRVPIGVRWISRPPKPARRVSFIRYSFNSTRRTFSTMMRLSFRLTFASAGISRHLFEDDLEIHGVLVPRTASAVRPRTKAFRRRALVGVDHAYDHRVRIFFPGEFRVRDRTLEDLEERLCRLHRIAGRAGAGLVRDPAIVLLHRHRLFQSDHLLKILARLVDGLPAQLAGELDGLLPGERELPAVRSGHRLNLVFDRVPELRHATSLQRHELRRSRRADARSAVRDRLPRHGELADVMPDHLRLDLDRHVLLHVVDRNFLRDEVREDR